MGGAALIHSSRSLLNSGGMAATGTHGLAPKRSLRRLVAEDLFLQDASEPYVTAARNDCLDESE